MTSAAVDNKSSRSYLIQFAHRHLDFRIPELEAVLTLLGVNPSECFDRAKIDLDNPFLERGVLVKAVYELWGSGRNYDQLRQSIASFDEELKRQCFDRTKSWKINVDAFGSSLSSSAQQERRQNLVDVLRFQGPVNLKAPDNLFWIFEVFEHTSGELSMASPDFTTDAPKKSDLSSSEPRAIYFLRTISGSSRRHISRGGARGIIDKQTLKKRRYLGPTSMDTELSLLMANQALVTSNSIVLDPFAGTGSILIACSTFGAQLACGTDIDIRVLRGKKGVNIFSNFQQYNLSRPDIIRCDNSRPPYKQRPLFDAIVCDPPYGIRAGARKSGSRRSVVQTIEEKHLEGHIPQTQPYPAEEVMMDLIKLAARVLNKGGRLVYVLPCTYDFKTEELPTHPCLEVVANSMQPMTTRIGRRIITMEKVVDYDEDKEQSGEYARKLESSYVSFANLREKLEMGDWAETETKAKAGKKIRVPVRPPNHSTADQSSSS